MKFRRTANILAVVLLLLAACWSARAQEPSATATAGQAPPSAAPVLKAESRVVRVDVIVTDKKGNYIHDLTAKDFRVFDNDKEQPIVNFSFGTSPDSSAAPDRHYMVLFFDDSTMSVGGESRSRQAALKFIDANAGPDRVMAVVDFTRALRVVQNFTADATRLKRAAESAKSSAVSPNASDLPPDTTPRGPALADTQSDFGVYTLLLGVRSLARNLANLPGRKSVILFTSGFPLTPEGQAELTATISACNQANVAIYPLDVGGLIATAPGPGAELYRENSPAFRLSESRAQAGEPSTWRPRMISASYPASPAAKPADPAQHGGGPGGGAPGGGGRGPGGGSPGGGVPGAGGGMGNIPPMPGEGNPFGQGNGSIRSGMIVPVLPETGSTNQSVLYALAAGTGGFPIMNTNDLVGGLGKIAHEQDEYYFLGYSPSDSADGSCHALRVKIEHGGMSVRARSGYCSSKPKDMLAGKPIEKDLEAHAAAPAAGSVGGSLEAPFFYTSPNEARVDVAMEIPSASVEFSKDKGKYHADVNVLGIAYLPDGSVGARFSDEIAMDLEKDQWKQFTQKPMHYANQFEVAPGSYRLTVVLSAGGQNFGKYETSLVVDPYDGKTFTLSGLALSDHVSPVEGMGGALEADLLADRTPLIMRNMQVVPSGSNHFKRTESVALYAQVYDPHLTDANPPVVRVSFNITDAKTGAKVIDAHDIDTSVFVEKGNPVLPVGLKVPLDKFPAGSYRLEMQAQDATGAHSAVRTVTFDTE